MRLGVMGGTFDPIHVGHLVAASEAGFLLGLDEVIFVPTGQPWQKGHRQVTAAPHRLTMCLRATADNPRFAVSCVDVDRPGPTYTVDTLRDLAAAHPGAHLAFITGADALRGILTWRDADEVLRRAQLVGVTRPGHVLVDPGVGADRVTLIDVPALAISSTDIRDRVRRGAPIDYLVPAEVAEYITEQGLYQPDAGGGVAAGLGAAIEAPAGVGVAVNHPSGRGDSAG